MALLCPIQHRLGSWLDLGHTLTLLDLCRYALNGREVTSILMQRFVKVDGKVRTDSTYPAGLMDVIEVEKTDEHFRLVYDAKGRFQTHRITKVCSATVFSGPMPMYHWPCF